MREANYQNAFGKAPDSFKNRVTSALVHKEEEKMKRFSIGLIVIAAILLVLMAGVVYAASTEWKLLDWFDATNVITPSEKAIAVINGSRVDETYEVGDYLVTLEEAVADGRLAYIGANVRMKSGEKVYFLPTSIYSGMSLDQLVGHHFDYSTTLPNEPLAYEAAFVQEFGQPDTFGDNRSIRQAALEDERRMINVHLWFTYQNKPNAITTFTVLPDGSVTFLMGANTFTEDKTVAVDLILVAREVDENGKYTGDTEPKHIPISLPVLPVQETRVFDAIHAKVEGTDVTVNRIEFNLTPLTLHFSIFCDLEENAQSEKIRNILFTFRNEQNERIYPGLGFWANIGRFPDKRHLIMTGTLLLDQIPDSFYLKARPTSSDISPTLIHVEGQ